MIKKTLSRVLPLAFACMATFSNVDAKDVYVSTSFHEPATDGLRFIYSYDGLHWDNIQGTFLTPLVGKQKVMRDPSIVKGPDGTFHLVWTSSWRGDRGFGYAHSKDLIHWSKERFISVMPDTTTVNVWAPELFYDDVKKQYMIIWASCIPGKFPDGLEDHKNNQRLYYTTTKDFKHFSETKLLIEPGFSSIDATMVKRGKNDYVLVFKDNTRKERDVKVAFSTSPYGPWSAASKPFTDKFCEGPSTAKVGDWYYIYFDSYEKKIYDAVKTRDFKNFKRQTDAVKFPVGHKHGTVFMADENIVNNLIKENRDAVHYIGKTIARPERHDGGLKPVVGVHNIQIMRGADKWLYNHQSFLAYWNNRFYLSYLTNPRSEHEMPGRTMFMTSKDGYTWTAPKVLFPEYNVPDGYTKESLPGIVAKNAKAIMHQRVGFYVAKNGKLLAIGNYGVALTPKDDPNDGNGIGRVVREVKADGSFGPIYFIYYNHGFNEKNTDFPNYRRSKDRKFVKACEEMIANPLQRMQWVEEADRNDSIIPLQKPYKAFCSYTLPDGRKVALWKHALTSMSSNGGNTWRTPVNRAHGFVNSNAKIWGQRLTDGTYATVYNPAEYRWPLAISLSSDGLEYNTLSLVHGDVTPERHWGRYKSYGPQYTRGIQEGNGIPKDSDMWVTYSNNKEDIWVSRVPVPVKLNATAQADGSDFSKYKSLADMTDWNIYSPLFAPVKLDGEWISLSDKDPYDYAKVEKLIPNTKEVRVEFKVRPMQNNHGQLDIDFLDDNGNMASRIVFDSLGVASVKGGARFGTLIKKYEADKTYRIRVLLSQDLHKATYFVNGEKACERMFDTPVESFSRIVFRTGDTFTEPNYMTPADQWKDMPRADEVDAEATFKIKDLKTISLDGDGANAVLKFDDYKHYVDKFNTMEDENIKTDIPNSESAEWMNKNIPLFDCPDKAMEEMYYYRWWSLRKHFVRTPQGYGMDEFLVKRSYADNYNLISSALGHHVMETRWIRSKYYLKSLLNTWYLGNDGKAMAKLNKYSQWTPSAVYEAYKVYGDTSYIKTIKPALEEQYAYWQNTHRLKNGLYWQADVQDAMEESISGGRKKQFARPTISSYMYGNAMALAAMNRIMGDEAKAKDYEQKADTLKNLVNAKLWNKNHQFFETMRGDTLAQVREAIGYMPWYVNMPVDKKYDAAWLQTNDDKGFAAPYGLTTAEMRHPLFRSHGVGKCEWDGAIWPFATSQTLTAMANYLNGDGEKVISDSVFFNQMKLYVQSQHHRGLPYIGEYLDEQNGNWLMGDRERSRYYNHSTFADLIITGIVGLRPQADGSIKVNPLIPENTWDYFCLDGVNYHDHILTIIYDKTGSHYHQGKGLIVLVDGKRMK